MSHRDALKVEIANYFLESGTPKEALPKVFKAFKKCADDGYEFQEFFATRHHEALNDFQRRYHDLDRELVFASTEMTRYDAEQILADSQSSPSLLKEATQALSEVDWSGLVDQAVGAIAKYLPMSANPLEANLTNMAQRVVDGELTPQQAADRLSNKKIITLKNK